MNLSIQDIKNIKFVVGVYNRNFIHITKCVCIICENMDKYGMYLTYSGIMYTDIYNRSNIKELLNCSDINYVKLESTRNRLYNYDFYKFIYECIIKNKLF